MNTTPAPLPVIGHQQIIFARSRGLPVPGVFLEDCAAPPARHNWLDVELALYNGGPPVVYVADAKPADVDLSFLRGLRVHLAADRHGIERWGAWVECLKALPVAHLIATFEGEFIEWRSEKI